MKRRNAVTEKAKTTEDLEKAIKKLHVAERPDAHAYNFKIPIDLYEEVQEYLENSGQTLKNFLIFSIRDYLKNNPIGKK